MNTASTTIESTEEPESAAAAGPQMLELTHDFFKNIGRCYFRLTEDTEEPALVVDMEDTSVSRPIPGIKREIGIDDDSPDGQMLDLVCESLNFIVAIRPGEEFPKGVVTGEASLEVADSVARLIHIARKTFGDPFDQLGAQTGEVVAVLKNIESQRQFIRETRNDLFRRLRAWEDIVKQWRSLKPIRSRIAEDLLRETYRFPAPRSMKVDEWDLVTTRYQQTSENRSEVRW